MGLGLDLSPLRHREFRLLFVSMSASFLGSMVTMVAVPFQVYRLTHSSLAVGLLGLVEFAAVVTTGLLGGALADAVDRRRMVLLTELVMAACAAGLALNAAAGRPSLFVLFGLTGLLTLVDGLQRPSLDGLLPRVVPREDVVAAGALTMLRGTTGMLLGPALGGLLLAVAGLPTTYLFDVATFLVSLVALSAMRAVPPPDGGTRPSVRGVLEGLRYARSRPELIGTYLVDVNAMFFGMPNALFPALATGLGGPAVLGLLYAAPAAGSVVATLTSGWTRRVRRQGLAVLWAAGAWGVAIVGFGLARPLWLAVGMLAAAGAADMVSGLFRMAIWNTTVPDHLRGRLAGIELLSYSTGPTLGNVEAGGLARLTSPRFSVVSGGVACVLGTLALAVAIPALRRYEPTTGR